MFYLHDTYIGHKLAGDREFVLGQGGDEAFARLDGFLVCEEQ